MKPRRWILLASLGGALVLWISHERHQRSPQEPAPSFEANPTLSAALAAGGFPEQMQHSLTGFVVREGEPAPEVMVAATGEGNSAFTWTRADGSFVLEGLRTGEVELILVAPLAPNLVTRAQVPSDGAMRLELPPAFPEVQMVPEVVRAPVEGRVEPAFTDSPEGLVVLFVPDTRNASPSGTPGWAATLEGRVLRSCVCDAEGRYELADLAAGAYRLVVLPDWAEGGDWPTLLERAYAHAPGATPPVLRCQSGRLTGALRGPDGSPISGARIEVRDAGRLERLWPAVLSAADGRFVISALPEGTYRVSVTTGSADHEQTVRVSALRATEIDFGPIVLFNPNPRD